MFAKAINNATWLVISREPKSIHRIDTHITAIENNHDNTVLRFRSTYSRFSISSTDVSLSITKSYPSALISAFIFSSEIT